MTLADDLTFLFTKNYFNAPIIIQIRNGIVIAPKASDVETRRSSKCPEEKKNFCPIDT